MKVPVFVLFCVALALVGGERPESRCTVLLEKPECFVNLVGLQHYDRTEREPRYYEHLFYINRKSGETTLLARESYTQLMTPDIASLEYRICGLSVQEASLYVLVGRGLYRVGREKTVNYTLIHFDLASGKVLDNDIRLPRGVTDPKYFDTPQRDVSDLIRRDGEGFVLDGVPIAAKDIWPWKYKKKE